MLVYVKDTSLHINVDTLDSTDFEKIFQTIPSSITTLDIHFRGSNKKKLARSITELKKLKSLINGELL